MLQRPGDAYAIWHFWHGPEREFRGWYVNLQEPFRRTAQGYDTQDLELDIWVPARRALGVEGRRAPRRAGAGRALRRGTGDGDPRRGSAHHGRPRCGQALVVGRLGELEPGPRVAGRRELPFKDRRGAADRRPVASVTANARTLPLARGLVVILLLLTVVTSIAVSLPTTTRTLLKDRRSNLQVPASIRAGWIPAVPFAPALITFYASHLRARGQLLHPGAGSCRRASLTRHLAPSSPCSRT